jgi:hypothetical protein
MELTRNGALLASCAVSNRHNAQSCYCGPQSAVPVAAASIDRRSATECCMYDDEIQIPVRCPRCGNVSLTEFPVLVVVTALIKWHRMRLYAGCHTEGWDADAGELARMRAYLGERWIELRSIQLAAHADFRLVGRQEMRH